jgi:hypothetical protein
MIVRMIHTVPFRAIALLLVTVLLIVGATPGKAEAIDALVIVAIAGLALAGIILIAYLIVANVEGGKSADQGQVIWVACARDECTPVPTATALPAPMPSVTERQGP